VTNEKSTIILFICNYSFIRYAYNKYFCMESRSVISFVHLKPVILPIFFSTGLVLQMFTWFYMNKFILVQ